MTLLTLLTTAALAGPFSAPDPDEVPWRDGLSSDAPQVSRLNVSQAFSPGESNHAYTDLTASLNLWETPSMPLSFGVVARGGVTALGTGQGTLLSTRSASAEVWTLLRHRENASYIGFGLGGSAPIGQNSTYLRHTAEAGMSLYGTVDAYLDSGRVDWQAELTLGATDTTLVHAVAGVSAAIELRPKLAAIIGGQVTATTAAWYTNVGLRGRPNDQLELGAHVLYDAIAVQQEIVSPGAGLIYAADLSTHF